jgi:hypothetical protein
MLKVTLTQLRKLITSLITESIDDDDPSKVHRLTRLPPPNPAKSFVDMVKGGIERHYDVERESKAELENLRAGFLTYNLTLPGEDLFYNHPDGYQEIPVNQIIKYVLFEPANEPPEFETLARRLAARYHSWIIHAIEEDIKTLHEFVNAWRPHPNANAGLPALRSAESELYPLQEDLRWWYRWVATKRIS